MIEQIDEVPDAKVINIDILVGDVKNFINPEGNQVYITNILGKFM